MDLVTIICAIAVSLAAAWFAAGLLARMGFPLPQGRRLGEIDGLRGFLALAVMCHHYIFWVGYKSSGLWLPPSLAFYNQLGKTGVGLFFMATGFVFYPRVLAGLRGNNWLGVYISRLFRIVPLLLVTVFVVTLIVMIETGLTPTRHYPLEVLSWVVGRQRPLLGVPHSNIINAEVLWSIYYEWLFYFLLLPACALARNFLQTRTWLVPAGLLIASLLARETGRYVFTFAPLFAIGMLAFEARSRPAIVALLETRRVAAIALAGLILGMTFWSDPFDVLALPLFAFFFICVACGNDLFGLLGTRGARVLGEASYGIYLIHGIVLFLGFTFLPAERYPLVALPLLGLAVTLIAACGFLVIERPCIRLGHKLRRWLTERRSAAADDEPAVVALGPALGDSKR
jgi:peptidoglycan/LPS O-acetylase OafA/YrhL